VMEHLSRQCCKTAILNFPGSESDIPIGTPPIRPNSRFTRRSETESYSMIRALGFCWNFKKPQSLKSVSRQPVPRGARSKARGKQAHRSRQRVWPAARRRGRLWDQGQNSRPTRRTRPQSFCRCLNALASACRPSAVRGLAREFPAAWRHSCSKTANPRRCLFGSLRRSLDHPHRAISPGVPTHKYANAPEKVSYPRKSKANRLNTPEAASRPP